MTSRDWHRLARYVRERRERLGITQEEAATRGGPSTATLRLIENAAQTSYRAKSLRQLEDVLEWAPRSVQDILDGGEPRLLDRDARDRGHALIDRRALLHPRWRSRADFAAAHGISEDLVRAVEVDGRQALSGTDLTALAGAYQVTPQSLSAFLRGDGTLDAARPAAASRTTPVPPGVTAMSTTDVAAAVLAAVAASSPSFETVQAQVQEKARTIRDRDGAVTFPDDPATAALRDILTGLEQLRAGTAAITAGLNKLHQVNAPAEHPDAPQQHASPPGWSRRDAS
jgi:X-X-X-Leu-X-X-Gly heptad repeat protein